MWPGRCGRVVRRGLPWFGGDRRCGYGIRWIFRKDATFPDGLFTSRHNLTKLAGLAGFLNLVGSNGAKWGNQGMLIGNPVQDAGYEIGLKGPKTDTLIIAF